MGDEGGAISGPRSNEDLILPHPQENKLGRIQPPGPAPASAVHLMGCPLGGSKRREEEHEFWRQN